MYKFHIIIGLLLLLFISCDKTPTDNNGEEHRIFFSSFWLNHSEVYIINADGSNKMQIVDGGIMTSPPVNNKIAFYSNTKNQSINRIFTATSEGKNVLQIAKSVDSQHFVINPVLSPDGNKVAYMIYNYPESGMSLYIVNFDGSNTTQLSNNAGYETIPAFSPDGNQITFYGNDEKLYIVNIDGSNLHSIVEGVAIKAKKGYTGLDWSPQGDKIICVGKNESGGTDIFVIQSDGNGLKNLTNNNLDNFMPVWSPDGNAIAYISESGDIWIMNSDGTGRKNLTNTPSNLDIFPHWSSDGKKIVYTTVVIEPAGYLRVVDVNSLNVTGLSSDVIRGFWEY